MHLFKKEEVYHVKAIIAVLAAAIIVGGAAGIVLMEDHDDSEKPTNYVETKTENYSSVINYNSKATLDPDTYSEIDSIYKGTYSNKMVFQIAEIDECVYAILGNAKGTDGVTHVFSRNSVTSVSKSFSDSVSHCIENTITNEFSHSYEITDGYGGTIGISSGDLWPVKVSAELSGNHETTNSDTESVATATTTSESYSKTVGEQYGSEKGESYGVQIESKTGMYYSYVIICDAYIFEVLSIEENPDTGEYEVKGIDFVISFDLDHKNYYVYESTSSSFEYKYATPAQNTILTDVQIKNALDQFEPGEYNPPEAIMYSVTFIDDSGERIVKYAAGEQDKFIAPAVTPRDDTFKSAWESYILSNEDQTVHAEYTDLFPGYTRISNQTELISIVNEPDGKYVLKNNISINMSNWAPISNFSGILDGNGKTITGLSFNSSWGAGTDGVVRYGLFERIDSGTVANLNIYGAQIKLTNNNGPEVRIGVIAGNTYGDTKITNCTVTDAKITYTPGSGRTSIGGIVGFAEDRSCINSCTVKLTKIYGFTEYTYCGGIAGTSFHNVSFSECSSINNTVKAEGSAWWANGDGWAGGIVGRKSSDTTLNTDSNYVTGYSANQTYDGCAGGWWVPSGEDMYCPKTI